MRKLLALTFVFVLAAAACGGDESGNAGTTGDNRLNPPEASEATSTSTSTSADTGRDASSADDDLTGDGRSDGDINDNDSTSDLNDDDRTDVVDLGSEDVVLTSRLVRFNECDSLLGHIRTQYSERVGPWGFDNGSHGVPFFAAEEASGGDDVFGDVEFEGGGDAFSSTNIQETGVDEADIIKTDGGRIFVLSGGRLNVVDVATRATIGSTDLGDNYGSAMFVSGDSVLVIHRTYVDVEDPDSGQLTSEQTRRRGGSTTVIRRINVDDGDPQVVSTMRVEGDYVTARSINGVARVVLRFDSQSLLPFVYPQNPAANAAAEQANRRAVLESSLNDWLPTYSLDDSDWQRLPECENVHAPSLYSGAGLTTVLSVPIDAEIDPTTATSVLAPGDVVYASATSLYSATTAWVPTPEPLAGPALDDQQDTTTETSIHRFDITDPAEAIYVSSGDVAGVIRNQFSLSEHGGHLRVVTTTAPRTDTAESQVRVLQEQGDQLIEVGYADNIGNGEQVQSVRFVGDIGYVVTFRQIDPFYTIDLSDPTLPTVRGELKIPGFSNYLHAIGDDLVLGVGSDATDEGVVTGAKVSLFDVSNLDDPREIAVWAVFDGWHNIGWDHRAFLWWAPENLAVIPVVVHDNDWAGAVLLRVADDGITEIGRIDHINEAYQPGLTDCRVITSADLLSPDGVDASAENQLYILESDAVVLACGPGQYGISGFACHDGEQWLGDDYHRQLIEHLILAADEALSICWAVTSLPEIVRSIVIGDELWTLSSPWGDISGDQETRLQVNDLGSLQRLHGMIP